MYSFVLFLINNTVTIIFEMASHLFNMLNLHHSKANIHIRAPPLIDKIENLHFRLL